jgi:ADP-ribose pyrophosphatase YjhB (NUDIX family)
VSDQHKWVVHDERLVDDTPHIRVSLADVELPNGVRFTQYLFRMRRCAMTLVLDGPGERLLLMRRHRFIVDRWVWELPGGYVDDGEDPAAGAARDTPSSGRRAYIARQLTMLRDLGIDVVPGIITYHAEMMPSELWDALGLIDACDIESAFFFLNRLIAYPGTAVYRRYAERGLLTTDWPVPRWEFRNPLIAHIEHTMLDAEKGGRSFAELRALFISLLREIAPERVCGKTGALADS